MLSYSPMEKQRKWQFLLILIVMVLTIYNILPTVFYYLKPLKEPLSSSTAANISASIADRIDTLEKDTIRWIRSFCDLIHTKPLNISVDPENPQLARVAFATSEDTRLFRKYFPRAGALIPFTPAQLALIPGDAEDRSVQILRKIPVRLEKTDFSYFVKNDPWILEKRIKKLETALISPSDTAIHLNSLCQGKAPFPVLETLAMQINAISTIEEPLQKRLMARFTYGAIENRNLAIQSLIRAFEQIRDSIRQEKPGSQAPHLLEKKETVFLTAEHFLKNHISQFAAGKDPIEPSPQNSKIDLSTVHPLFSELSLDLQNERFVLTFHPDVAQARHLGKNTEWLEQFIFDEIARISKESCEDLVPGLYRNNLTNRENEISIPLHHLPQISGYLVLDQKKLAKRIVHQLQTTVTSQWRPSHPDLAALQVVDYSVFQALPQEQKALCLVIASPLCQEIAGLQSTSLYIAGKGLGKIAKTYESFPTSPLALDFQADIQRLVELLNQDGFSPYQAPLFTQVLAEDGDLLFEKPGFLTPLRTATREDYKICAAQEMAIIELADREQRILAENRIDTQIHEDLLKWNDDYRAAQVSIDSNTRYDIPKPTKGTFWQNFLLSVRKFLRGDERKIIRWGLDLSGGKSVQIELIDSNKRPVINDEDLKQGINELYNRVNKMGVSEVSIRQVGHQIALDFPAAQAISASELIKASTMYFHIVNETFSLANPTLANSVHRFLQEIWNEAIATGKKEAGAIHKIAYKRLHKEPGETRSIAADELWENGLRLAPPFDSESSSALNDSLSKIAIFRGADWHGQTHPLMIVFHNRALDGTSLENIRAGYDPSKGNFLSFDIRSSYEIAGKTIHPRNDLHSWTSRYSRESIQGTPLETVTNGRGWRMAVLLNDAIINAPTLDAALKTSAMISGHFSQREVNRLATDLKAGSLSFTPHILSEKNISPELGAADRTKGLTAMVISLVLIILSMLAYYRFAGLVASIAVLLNLLILWATLQNLGATLTLAGLAAVVLTIGMAIDANVLVFERVKEELSSTGNIRSALSTGYQKAFSAIIDSNATTIIAALILFNFDAGPIKSFAVNLMIGIASSMFTALFMTRFYLIGWANKPTSTTLKMANWLRATHFNFLKQSKTAFAIAAAIMMIGLFFVARNHTSILGMDFTGGYSLNIELSRIDEKHYAPDVGKAFIASGASIHDFQIRELDPSHHLRILFAKTMELPSKPFHGMPIVNEGMENPRIQWIVDALQKQNISLAPHSKNALASGWTAVSGQVSDSMRNNALIGLGISFLAVFVYLAFRFEYKFAAAALICLFHDVFVTIGLIGLLHALGIEIQIDLNTIAALMTIIGYSLNDTIIIFDRIRETIQDMRGKPISEIVNFSLNATLSRTTITSGTTLLVLIALVVFGGSSIFGFALVMSLGVFVGTVSSWFIAAPLMAFFHGRELPRISRTL